MTHLAPAIDAAQGRAQVVLADRCTVRRDAEGTRDDTLDPDSLSYDEPADAVAVATGVPCKFNHELRNGGIGESGQPVVIAEYRVAFPQGTDVRQGDDLEVTASAHDPALVGQHAVVVEVMHGSFQVLKRCRARMRTEGVDLP